jgi:uncharacterized protein YjeT (DUF2065 family)
MLGAAISAYLVALVLVLFGLLHLIDPDRAWRLYRRPQPEPEDSTRFNLRLLGAALLAFAGLVSTVAYVFF